LQAQVNYTVGAAGYIFSAAKSNYSNIQGQNSSFGIVSDGVFSGTAATGTPIDLTTAWNFNAAYEHYWLKNWKTSVYGGYAAVSYNATANTALNTVQGLGVGGVNNNWSTYWIGSRTQWNVSMDTYLAVDLLYEKQNSGTTVTGALPTGFAVAGVATTVANEGNLMGRFRVHKDFYP
jgi:hypothetical protein